MRTGYIFVLLIWLFGIAGCNAKKLSCAGRSIESAYQDNQASNLVKAVSRGDVKALSEMVVQGADINYLEYDSVPILNWAICADNKKGYIALLELGADPNLAGTGSGIGSGSKEMHNYSNLKAGWSATMFAAANPNSDYLRLALQYGGSVKGSNLSYDKPLAIAAEKGNFEGVKILVSAGADLNAHHPIYRNTTAIVKAAIQRHLSIVAWLLENGASHELSNLASMLEIGKFSIESESQMMKERLINLLKEKGIPFPASPRLKREFSDRLIPAEYADEVIYGRVPVEQFPLKE